MPFGRLSPVSETDSESLHSSRAASVDLRPRPLNFSRPKPQDLPSSRNIHRDAQYANSASSSSSNAGGSIRGVGAFYESSSSKAQSLPDEPHFGSDDDHDADSITPSTHSAGSELVWDPVAGELRSKRAAATRRSDDFDAQRSAAPRRPPSRSYPTNGSTATESEQPLIAELPGDAPSPHIIAQQRSKPQPKAQLPVQPPSQPKPPPPPQPQPQQDAAEDQKPTFGTFVPETAPRIVKRTSFDQMSERMSICSMNSTTRTASNGGSGNGNGNGGGKTAGWEGITSRHTTSENGDQQSTTGVSEWKSSEFEISSLGEKKLAKLRKKGINPQLYMEMKAARGGKGKLVGPLVGNTYIG